MQTYAVTTSAPGEIRSLEGELAWRIAAVAADRAPLDTDVSALLLNRMIDAAGVAVAALDRAPVRNARAQALAHARPGGATVIGMPEHVRVHCEWAAIANAAAVRELDFHDNVFDVEIGHPADMIPAIVAVCQQAGRNGAQLLDGLATAYEIHVSLCKAIALHTHGIDHTGHLAPAIAAGLGTALELDPETIYQAVQQAVHTGYSPGQTRKGHISTWKSYAPGHASLIAINAVDRAMRGEDAPTPVFEGEQGLIAAMLGAETIEISLAEPGEPKRRALETFTKQHSAGYHGQAAIDIALKLRERIPDTGAIESIVYHTKSRTHKAMGSGSNDPRKYDPAASRETLDHSLMYVMAVALQDGEWHHVRSYLPERARRPDTVALWSRIATAASAEWDERYVGLPALERDHGGRAVVTLGDGTVIEEEIAVPAVHPRGSSPMDRPAYVEKFATLAEDIVAPDEQRRFLDAVERLPELGAGALHALNLQALCDPAGETRHGIY